MTATLVLPERDWQQQVLDLASYFRWSWYHTHDSRRSPAGFPDLVLCRDRVLFRELKTEQGQLTPAQKRWLEALRSAGADAAVWRPSDLERIQQELR
jgi:hypothetical protein